jgi:hypothetical protein
MVGLVFEVVSEAVVPGVRAAQVVDFMLEPTDEAYRVWWPGVHDRFHITAAGGRADHVGDRVVLDELVGPRRLRMAGRVVEVVPARRVVWQLHKGVPLPVRLVLELEDQAPTGGAEQLVRVRHTVRAGWPCLGRVFDPLFRLYFSRRFAADLDAHVRTEFTRLGTVLRARRSP